MKLKYLILIFILLTVSCDRYKINHDLNKLTSCPIVIPDSLMTLNKNNDTNNWYNNFSNSQYKFIHYMDSTTCIPCEFGYFHKWDSILAIDSLTSGKIKFYFIINPSYEYKHSITRHYQISDIKYPIFIDSCSYFEKGNKHFPKSKIFHSFLLNEFNQVIYVGNPTADSSLCLLFYNIIKNQYKEDLLNKK